MSQKYVSTGFLSGRLMLMTDMSGSPAPPPPSLYRPLVAFRAYGVIDSFSFCNRYAAKIWPRFLWHIDCTLVNVFKQNLHRYWYSYKFLLNIGIWSFFHSYTLFCVRLYQYNQSWIYFSCLFFVNKSGCHYNEALNFSWGRTHLHERTRKHPQSVNCTQRNPDNGGQSNDPANALSPGREDIVPIASRFELDDGENQNDLAQRDRGKEKNCETRCKEMMSRFSLCFYAIDLQWWAQDQLQANTTWRRCLAFVQSSLPCCLKVSLHLSKENIERLYGWIGMYISGKNQLSLTVTPTDGYNLKKCKEHDGDDGSVVVHQLEDVDSYLKAQKPAKEVLFGHFLVKNCLIGYKVHLHHTRDP